MSRNRPPAAKTGSATDNGVRDDAKGEQSEGEGEGRRGLSLGVMGPGGVARSVALSHKRINGRPRQQQNKVIYNSSLSFVHLTLNP